MPKVLLKTIYHGFGLVLRLLGVVLQAIQQVVDIIDDGIKNGSAHLPSWYFELVDILNVLSEYTDKLEAIGKSDEFKSIEK